jgi:hypothetical protein
MFLQIGMFEDEILSVERGALRFDGFPITDINKLHDSKGK